MNFLKKAPEVKTLVVEVPNDLKVGPLTEELAQQLAMLQLNPAFIWLLGRLQLQRALLKSELETKRQASMIDSEFIKSGIAWTGWLEDQLRQAAAYGKRQAPPREALDEELEAFKLAQSQLEFVGRA